MIEIKKYTDADKSEWNNFCNSSKNPLFMFKRDFMEYHKDRFVDNSLMFYETDDSNSKKELLALLPMNIKGNALYSHGGLTYGGFITDSKMKQHLMLDCFKALKVYAENNNVTDIIYKQIPHIYHMQPSEEDIYALFVNNAVIEKIEASTVINLKNPLKMPKGRKAQISRAKRDNVIIEEKNSLEDFKTFITLENKVLSVLHGTKAVHTGEELNMLHSYFPNNIHLFAAMHKGKMIAGTVVFEYDKVVHTQYMAADEEARTIGALDLTISTVIDIYKDKKDYLDFGISTENGGRNLNYGLISQKEGFGGRTVAYVTWRMSILKKYEI